MINVSALYSIIGVSMIILLTGGCAPSKTDSAAAKSAGPAPAPANTNGVGKGLSSANAKKLIANTWCMVNDSGETFHSDVAIGYSYAADGTSALKFLELDRSKGSIESKLINGKWGIEDDRLAIFDPGADRTFVSRLSWFQFVPKMPVNAIWREAVAKGKQLCLKAQNAQDPKKFGIHCRCDLDRIKK